MAATREVEGSTSGLSSSGTSNARARSSRRSRRSCQGNPRRSAPSRTGTSKTTNRSSLEPAGRQLAIEYRPVPEVRQLRSEAPEAHLECVAQPVAPFGTSIACLDRSLRAVDDESADAIDLRLTSEAIWVGDGLSQGTCTVIRDELRNHAREHHGDIAMTACCASDLRKDKEAAAEDSGTCRVLDRWV